MKKNRLYLYTLYLAAYLILLWGYYIFITRVFAYMGFEWYPNPIKIIESMMLLFVVLGFMPIDFRKPSDILVHVQLLFPILGMLVMYGAADESRPFMMMTIFSFMLVVLMSGKVVIKKIRLPKIQYQLFILMISLISISVLLVLIFILGPRSINFDISRVYEFRSIVSESLPKIFGYINPIAGKVFFPSLVVLGLIRKNWILIFSGIGGGVMMFGLTSHKGPLLYPILAFGFYYLLQMKNVIPILLIGVICLVLVPLFVYVIYPESILINSLFLRRIYFVPGHLNFIYYDFFSTNPFVYWANSKISLGLVNYAYDIDTSHLIGREFYSNELMGANTGWIGSGYMHLGFWGMLIYALSLGGLLSLLNSFSRASGKVPILALSIVILFSLMTSSDFPAALLTHGLIVLILILNLLPNTDKINKNRQPEF